MIVPRHCAAAPQLWIPAPRGVLRGLRRLSNHRLAPRAYQALGLVLGLIELLLCSCLLLRVPQAHTPLLMLTCVPTAEQAACCSAHKAETSVLTSCSPHYCACQTHRVVCCQSCRET